MYLCKCFKNFVPLKKFVPYLLVLLLLATSCGVTGKLDKADCIYEEGGYAKAATTYRTVVRSKKLTKAQQEQAYYNYAECYRRTGNPKSAETAYAAMLRLVKTPSDPEVYLRYGQVLLANEKHDRAKDMFGMYKSLRPDDPQADAALTSVEWAKQFLKTKITEYKIEPAKEFNSSLDDFSPVFGADDYETILFTSIRKEGNESKKKSDITGRLYTDIYFSRLSVKGKWERPKNIGKEINTKYDEGAAVFNSSFTTLYFTRCDIVKREKLGCKIYKIDRNDTEWGEAVDLKLVPDSLTAAHPAISDDELTLYFISDMTGGMGKMDIWKVTRGSASDDWGEPINMGSQINTQGSEMYPFARADGSLYFASDGHPGFGGLDIYKATVNDSIGGWNVENVGTPINSSADDFAIIFERDNERGYFTSRRVDKKMGTTGGDDIFRFALDVKPIEYFFDGVVKDEKTGRVLEAVDIRLIGSNGATLRKITEADGTVRFRVNVGLNYLMIASREGYLNNKLRFSTENWEVGHVHKDVIFLTATDKPIEIPNIFFDFGKATLNDSSRVALDLLVEVMKDNPGIIVELRAHTDNRGSLESNNLLSQQRAQSVVDYLIYNGVDEARLEAVGFGESQPKVVDITIARQYNFLRVGQKLDERFINNLKNEEQQEICHQLNRRTEMQVIRNDYVPE